MPLLKRQSRGLAWVASVAILLAALAPTVSRWLATSHVVSQAMLEVCVSRVGGPSTLALKSMPDESSAKFKVDHCPLCVMHAGGWGLPPDGLHVVILRASGDVLPALFLNAPSLLHVWALALARAPPIDVQVSIHGAV